MTDTTEAKIAGIQDRMKLHDKVTEAIHSTSVGNGIVYISDEVMAKFKALPDTFPADIRFLLADNARLRALVDAQGAVYLLLGRHNGRGGSEVYGVFASKERAQQAAAPSYDHPLNKHGWYELAPAQKWRRVTYYERSSRFDDDDDGIYNVEWEVRKMSVTAAATTPSAVTASGTTHADGEGV